MPAWAVPAIYAAVCLILFRETIIGGVSLLGEDSFALSHFARDFYTDFVRTLQRFPQWNPLLFGGMPFVDGMHGDIFYPPSLALFWMDARVMWGWKMVLHYFLAGVFTYLWLRSLALRRGPAFLGGLIYMMGPQLVTLVYPGGDGKLFVATLAPLVFWLAERAAQHRGVADFAWFGLGVAAIVFTSHMQLAYFCIWGVSLYFFFRIAQIWRVERRGGAVARLAGMYILAGVLGVGAAAVQFFPPLGYLREWSHRAERTVEAENPAAAYAYATSWSLHAEEAMALVVPEFIGDNAPTETRRGNTYWGQNPFKFNHEYAGFVPLVLAMLLFATGRQARVWFFAALAVLSLLYALGANTPVFRLFYLIPGVNLFRAPSLIIFLFGLSVATLGALGAQRLLDTPRWSDPAQPDRARRCLWAIAAVFGALALLASTGVLTTIWVALFRSDLTTHTLAALQANTPYIQLGFWITAALAALVAGTWEALARRWIQPRDALIILALLCALDLYRVGRPFVRATVLMNQAADPAHFRPDETITFLQGRAAAGEIFRVFDLGPLVAGQWTYPRNGFATHGIEQLAGHHGNEIGRYRELLGGEFPENALHSDWRLFDLLNVGYLISPGRIEMVGWEEVHIGQRAVVYHNTNARPRAFLADRAEPAGADVIDRMLASGFDPRVALLGEPLPDGWAPEAGATGTVAWRERGSDAVRLDVTTSGRALLVIMDNHYPAWHAEVNGEPAPILRVHHAFRAVPLEPGTHVVRLHYESPTLSRAAFTSVAVLLLLLGVGIGGTIAGGRRGTDAA